MKTKTINFIILIILVCLNVCETQPFNSNSASASETQSSPQDKKIAAFMLASGGTGGYMLPIAATNSFIANKIMLASLKAGSGSTAVDSLTTLLKSGKYQQIAVFSENDGSDEITAATIEAAFKKSKRN